MLGVPYITLRENTEWVETVGAGWKMLVGADGETIAQEMHCSDKGTGDVKIYGKWDTAKRIIQIL